MSSTIYATGKRKTAVAKVWISQGEGDIVINNKTMSDWIDGRKIFSIKLKEPLSLTKQTTNVNIRVVTLGGGYSAQIDSIVHGISKALVKYDESFRTILKPLGFLTRDARVVERKKPGRKKARKLPQFSKR